MGATISMVGADPTGIPIGMVGDPIGTEPMGTEPIGMADITGADDIGM